MFLSFSISEDGFFVIGTPSHASCVLSLGCPAVPGTALPGAAFRTHNMLRRAWYSAAGSGFPGVRPAVGSLRCQGTSTAPVKALINYV